jgi:uncharacterized SAM-binding protein YcdF (DUF218 family)
MFLFKKIVAPLFLPMTLILGILVLGLFLILLTRRQKTGKIVVLIGTIFVGMLSYNAVSDKLLQPLEYQYPPLVNSEKIQNVKWVVVLGGGHISDPKLPITSQISNTSLIRLVEGVGDNYVRVARHFGRIVLLSLRNRCVMDLMELTGIDAAVFTFLIDQRIDCEIQAYHSRCFVAVVGDGV